MHRDMRTLILFTTTRSIGSSSLATASRYVSLMDGISRITLARWTVKTSSQSGMSTLLTYWAESTWTSHTTFAVARHLSKAPPRSEKQSFLFADLMSLGTAWRNLGSTSGIQWL